MAITLKWLHHTHPFLQLRQGNVQPSIRVKCWQDSLHHRHHLLWVCTGRSDRKSNLNNKLKNLLQDCRTLVLRVGKKSL